MTNPAYDPWTGRWSAEHVTPAIGLCQRKPWDVMAPADHCDPGKPKSDTETTSLEVAVVGADAPWGRFALPDESPVFLPHNYEPNYPYPLVVWLHDSEWTARELLDLVPRISPQNFLGLSVEGLTPTNRFAAGPMSPPNCLDPLDGLLETLKDVAGQMRREFHVHSERIYLAGFGDQAAVALQMMIRRPEWFAGALAFGLRSSKLDPITNYDDLRGKRVFLSAGIRDVRVSLPDQVALGRLLRSAGVNAVLRSYDAGEEPSPKLLSDINLWLMNSIYESTLV